MAEQPDVIRQLQDLLSYPREDLDTEIKGWIPLNTKVRQAYLVKAIIAIANHGGGYILMGFEDKGDSWQPLDPDEHALQSYTQDRLNVVLKSWAEPSFHCEVHPVPHPENRNIHPVVIVPGEHRVPIRARRDGPGAPEPQHLTKDTIYIRRPGPESAPIQTTQEWNDLINRCVRAARNELLDGLRSVLYGFFASEEEFVQAMREAFFIEEVRPRPKEAQKVQPAPPERPSVDYWDILKKWTDASRERFETLVEQNLSDEDPSRYANGVWTVSYGVQEVVDTPSLSELLEKLRSVKGHETGWPPWWIPTKEELAPYPHDGVIECWLKDTTFGDGAHSDFWRVSPDAQLFLLRGYQEDGADKLEPGMGFDLTIPVWRVGECLLHAERLAEALDTPDSIINFAFTWEGLEGRTLVNWSNPRRILSWDRTARQDKVTSTLSTEASKISAALPELVAKILDSLYEIFDFFEPPRELYQEELRKMRGRQEESSK